MKKILAFLMLCISALQTFATVTITAPVKPDVMNEELHVDSMYYLYNLSRMAFVNHVSSYAGWSETPYAFRLDSTSDGHYAFHHENGYFGSWGAMPWSTSGNYIRMDIEPQGDGLYKIIYVNDNTYIGNEITSNYLHASVGTAYQHFLIIPVSADLTMQEIIDFGHKQLLYSSIVAADAKGYYIKPYEDIYNDETKTNSELNAAAIELNTSSSLSEAHSYLFPEWSDYPILITNIGSWSREGSYDHLWKRTRNSGNQESNTFKCSVYVDEPSTFSFGLSSNYDDARKEDCSVMPFKVYVDGEVVYEYNGETWRSCTDSYFGQLHTTNKDGRYDPYGDRYSYYNGSFNFENNYHFIELAPGHHLVDIVNTQEYSSNNYFYMYLWNIGVEKTPTIEVNLAKEGSLGDEVLRAMDNHPLIAESNIRNVRKLKISGKMGDADFEELYNMTQLYSLDLSGTNVTDIKTRQLSYYNHSSLAFLHELKLPKNLKTIGQEAFYCTQISDVDIPETVTSIGDFAFSNTRLRNANLPNVTTFGHNAFRGCTMLNNVVMKNVESMGIGTFAECYNLKNVEFEGTLKTVSQRTFVCCDEMENISIPECVTSIEDFAFYRNNKSKLNKLPSNLTTLGTYAFYCNYDATFSLPKTLTTISGYALHSCENMVGSIPSTVTSIGEAGMAYCHSFDGGIPESISSIGTSAFIGCEYRNADTLFINSYANYGATAFASSKMKHIVLTQHHYNVQASQLFANCDSLQSIKLMSPTKMTVNTNCFDGLTKKNIRVIVPDYLRTTYMRDSYWMDFTIETFPTTELDSIVIRQDLALSQHDRFEGKPDLAIEKGVKFELEGVAGMDLKNVTLNSDLEANSYSQIVSGTDNVSVEGLASERLYTKANKWYFLSLPFDCNLSQTVNENGGRYAIRYYNGASRAKAIDRSLYPYPESAHEYTWNLSEASAGNKQTFTYPNAKKLLLLFNSKCKVQDGPLNDLIHIRDGNGNERSYDDTELANAEIVIDGNTFDIWITSDGRGIQGYGYSIDYIYPDPEEGANYKTWTNYDCTKDIIPAGTGFIFMTSQDSWTRFYSVDNGTKNRVFEDSENENNEFHYELQKHPSENSANRGWNLVGNPYPNYYNNHKLSFAAPITLWDGTTYKAYSLRDDDIAIKPNQAVFVQCPEDVAEISWPAAGRQTSNVITDQANARPRAAIASNRQLIDLSLTNGTYTDDTRVVINPEASLGYELGCDAGKFMSMDNTVQQLYTLDANNNRYSINERPIAEGSVALGTYFPTSGTYTFSLKRNQAQRVLLTDNETGFTHDLTTDDYVFTAKAGTYDGRFMLTVETNEASGIDAVETSATAGSETYTVDGIRMSNASKAGVYIVNGKKVAP